MQAQPVMRAEPTAIRIEMGEEVLEARKSARGKTRIALGIIAVASLGVGTMVGKALERKNVAESAVKDAQALVVKITKANATATELSKLLETAVGKFKEQKFPKAEASKLGDLNIAFTAADVPPSIGRFSAAARAAVLTYVRQAAESNERKESLQNILASQEKAFGELLADRANPKVRWAAVVAEGSSGPWIELAQVVEPFLVKAEGKEGRWPSPMNVRRFSLGGGQPTEAKADRIEKTELRPQMAMPVNPATQGVVCGSDVLGKMQMELRKVRETLAGDETPGEEKEGLIKLGEGLIKELNKIGTSG